MRLRRLDLIRYGLFTGGSIDFGERKPGRRDLHIIYGPNETGKTTTVAAYLDLLYGIKAPKYAFLHSESTMQIGAALEIGGRLHEFIRIKTASNSLLDAHGQPIPESAIRAELGAIERDGYRAMFSLDDDTLEKGGEDILKSRGDLGQLLFSASAGLSELSQQLALVRGDADGFYKFHGRNTRLAQLKDKLARLKADRDSIDTQASKYGELVQTRNRLAGQYEAALAARGAIQSRMEEVQRHLFALPGLARLRSIRDQLAPLEDILEAPQAWAEEAPQLIKQELTLGARLEGAGKRVAELEADIGGMVVSHVALSLADRMERLGELRARHVTADKDIPKLKDELGAAERTIRGVLVRLGRPNEKDPQPLTLDAGLIGRLRDLLETRSGIGLAKTKAAEELTQARQDLDDAKAALREAGGSSNSGDDARVVALSKAVAAARAVDHPGRCRTAKRLSDGAAGVLKDRLGELKPWQGDGAALAAMTVPADDDIERWKLALAEAQRRMDQHAGEVERLTSDLTRLSAERDAIGGTTGVVTDEEAAQIRGVREQAWALHRQALDEASAAAFETALRRDDLAVNGRLLHATELADLHRASQELAIRQAECERSAKLLAKATAQRQAILDEVAAAVRAMGPAFPDNMTLAQLEAWLGRRDWTIEGRRQAQEAEAELAAAEDDAAAATQRLAAALKAAGMAAGGGAELDDLLAAADAAVSAETTLKHLRSEVRDCEREMTRRERADEQAKAADAEWAAAWTEACASCWLGETGMIPQPSAVRGTLEALAELDPALTTKASLTRRIAGMERDQKQFVEEVAAMAGQLGLTVDDPAAAARLIVERVKAAEAAEARLTEAEEALRLAREEQKKFGEDKAILQEAKTRMTAFFGVETLAEVEIKLASLARRAELRGQLAKAEEEILEALRVKTIAEAEAALEAMDRDALERERIDLKARFDDEDKRCRELFSESSNAAAAVEAIGGDAKVAEIEERRRTVMLEAEDEARRYLRLRMGAAAMEQALRLYRDRHRSSMMKRASEAFGLISRGAYSKLEPQRRKDGEVLLAITAGGASKEADQLSKGTRFQLYLALRVAGYHEFARTRSPVPFVCDDIMETFDDFRAEEAFRLLADMAEVGQVIYLTHHGHLCDIATRVCPGAQVHRLGSVAAAL